jgi:hypothetical protein
MPRPAGLVAHVIAAIAYVAVLFEVATDIEDPDEDHQVLLEQLDCTGNHLANCIWALHPQWAVMSQRESEERALELFRLYRPRFTEDVRPIDLLHDALERAIDGANLARKGRTESRYRDVALELGFVADHLEVALYLLDPDSFAAAIDATTPGQRVKLASRLEIIELDIDLTRQAIRERKGSGLRN